MIDNGDVDSKLVEAIHFSHFDPGHTSLLNIAVNTFPIWIFGFPVEKLDYEEEKTKPLWAQGTLYHFLKHPRYYALSYALSLSYALHNKCNTYWLSALLKKDHKSSISEALALLRLTQKSCFNQPNFLLTPKSI